MDTAKDTRPLIYIVDDEPVLCTELARLLELQDMRSEVCVDFEGAAGEIVALRPACVVLDLKLPGTDGHAICRDVHRADPSIPIVILTSSDSEFDEVMALNLGAWDYVTKPYRPAVLIARIRAIVDRGAARPSTEISHRDVRLDTVSGVLAYQGRTVELSRNELRILALLMANAGAVLSRQEIMCDLWESDAFVDDNTLTVNVNRVRKALESIGVPDDFLVTRRGLGYEVR